MDEGAPPSLNPPMDRRRILRVGALGLATVGGALGAGWVGGSRWPITLVGRGAGFVRTDRPACAQGVQSGDLGLGRAVVWGRTDRPCRMWVEWSTRADFKGATTVRGPEVLATTDFTGQCFLDALPEGARLHYRVRFEDLTNPRNQSEPCPGQLQMPGDATRAVRFFWSGDTCGQGFGINPDFGGLRIFDTMRGQAPDFFVHCGDVVYADGPLEERVTAADGSTWRNVVTDAKLKVSESLEEFRGQYLYNLLDEPLRRFNAEVAQLVIGDDHEIVNDWDPRERVFKPARYRNVPQMPQLAATGRRAFREYVPLRHAQDRSTFYRARRMGPLCELLLTDTRAHRGLNSRNDQADLNDATHYWGDAQRVWLRDRLIHSTATWKVVVAAQPLSLVIRNGAIAFDSIANAKAGPPLGRELELAWLLAELKRAGVRNVVWLCADVHYTAAHHYAPERAAFTDFDPFWEFVSGPLNAGTFGPNPLDPTFGPRVAFQKHPEAEVKNLPPSAGLQFYGDVRIDPQTRAMTVVLRDLEGRALHTQSLEPA